MSAPARPVRAAELATLCPAAVHEMRRVLRQLGQAVPPERYSFEDDGPELMRYHKLQPNIPFNASHQCKQMQFVPCRSR